MNHPEGAGAGRADRVDFDPRVRLEFRGTQLSSDGGLLVMRELDDALWLSQLALGALRAILAAIQAQTERKRLERPVRRAEKHRCRARMMRVDGPSRPPPGVSATANTARGVKSLLSGGFRRL